MGNVTKAQAISWGRPQKLAHPDCQYLLSLAHHKPTLFLNEYACWLQDGQFLTMSLETIHKTFTWVGLSVKRVQKLAAECSPAIHADFVYWISQYPTNYLPCLDEVSKDDHTYTRLWGWSQIGMWVEQHDLFVYKRCLWMVAALALDEVIVAAKVWEDSFTTDTFLEYLWDDVVCLN